LADKINQVTAAAAKEIKTLYAVGNVDNLNESNSDSDSGFGSSSFVSVGDFEEIIED